MQHKKERKRERERQRGSVSLCVRTSSAMPYSHQVTIAIPINLEIIKLCHAPTSGHVCAGGLLLLSVLDDEVEDLWQLKHICRRMGIMPGIQ